MFSDLCVLFFFQAEDGIRDHCVTGVQTCALPISERDSSLAKRGSPARLPSSMACRAAANSLLLSTASAKWPSPARYTRSEEHTSELQSHSDLVCRLLLEKKKHDTVRANI